MFDTIKQIAVFGLIASTIILAGCRKERPEEMLLNAENPTGKPNYDKILEDLLSDYSGGDLSVFKMPESYDFANIPQDPLNPITQAKVNLGKLLFHETAMGIDPQLTEGMQTFSCASCHFAQGGFQANRQQGIGEGGVGFGMAGEARVPSPSYSIDKLDIQPIRTPTAMNGAWQEVMLWNGQFGATGPNAGTQYLWMMDSPVWNNQFGHQGLETQAIAGMGVHRLDVDDDLCEQIPQYKQMFDLAFPDWLPSTRYSKRTAGLAIAAYERTLISNKAPWQKWLKGDKQALSDSEKRGAILFFGKAECVNCHSGPALNSMTFHALGMPDMEGPGVYGTSPDQNENKGRGGFTQNPADMYKFKTPQLYNLKDSPHYGHGGTFKTLKQVIEYKNNGIPANSAVPASQISEHFKPLNLTDDEINDLVNFLKYGLYDNDLMRYVPSDLPSGNCFPNNDFQSQIDQGCIL